MNTRPQWLLDRAKTFASYVENYGQHHTWCDRLAQALAPCNCGFHDVLVDVARFNKEHPPASQGGGRYRTPTASTPGAGANLGSSMFDHD